MGINYIIAPTVNTYFNLLKYFESFFLYLIKKGLGLAEGGGVNKNILLNSINFRLINYYCLNYLLL